MSDGILHESNARGKGSVLVFAVVVLAILAMLSTAFLVVAKHALQASRSGVNGAQSDLAALTAQQQSTNSLHTAVLAITTETPDGVVGLDPVSGQLSLISASESQNKGPNFESTAKLFEHDTSMDTASTPSFAVLSNQYPDARFKDVNGFATTPYYTTAPLRISSLATGADRASTHYIQAGMADFYNGVSSTLRKQLPNVGTIRGRHFIWVRDLDANFYAVPAQWGLRDPSNTSGTAYSAAEQALATKIISYLRTTPASYMADVMSADDPGYIAQQPATASFDSIGSFALQFPSYPTYENGAHFQDWRADLENYFTTCLDAPRNPDGTYAPVTAATVSQCKMSPAAININTAPEEVIQALLSQIPTYDPVAKMEVPFCQYFPANASPIPPSKAQPSLAELVAKRIVAMRPFLCRIDFEDFVASLLPGDPNDIKTPVGAIKYAITKRYFKPAIPADPDGTPPVAGTPEMPELTLAQFMEIPGLPEGDYPNGDVNPYKGRNLVTNMANRFEQFISDTESDPNDPTKRIPLPASCPLRSQCVLSVKAFNNLLNSVSSPPVRAAGATGAVSGYSYYSYDCSGPSQTPIPWALEYKPIRFMNADPNTPYGETFINDPANFGKFGKFVYGVSGDLSPTNTAYKNYLISDLKSWSCVGDGTLSGFYDMWFNLNDVMFVDLGKEPDDRTGGAGTHAIEGTNGQTLLTGINALRTNDVQVVPFGDPVTAAAPLLIVPGPSGQLETTPGIQTTVGISRPFSIQQPTAAEGDDKIVNAIRLASDPAHVTTMDPQPGSTDVKVAAPDGRIYIYPTVGDTPQTPLGTPGDATDFDTMVKVIVDGGDKICSTSTTNDDVRVATSAAGGEKGHIEVGHNMYNESFVWGPIRASHRVIDEPWAPDQIPSATSTSGFLKNGDVAWSPQICYRSRYYGTYVLAQGLVTQPIAIGTVSATAVNTIGPITFAITDGTTDLRTVVNPGAFIAISSIPPAANGLTYVNPQTHVYTVESFIPGTGTPCQSGTVTLTTSLVSPVNAKDAAAVYTSKVAGERRVESIYDAFNDEILWSRSPLTDKRGLGDPDPLAR